MLIAIRHFLKLLSDTLAYCWINEVWWPIPVMFLLLFVGAMAFTTQVATPFIYTLF